ncbi:MAG: hypothetical protein Fur0041_17550 [Bacteroidia bacterium]
MSKTCYVCDSLDKVFYKIAIALTEREVQSPASPYYDSLTLPEKRISEYHQAMKILYNNLDDSVLFGLHNYRPQDASNAEDIYTLEILAHKRFQKKWMTDSVTSGIPEISAVLKAASLQRSGPNKKQKKYTVYSYRSSKPLNKNAIQRRLSEIENIPLFVTNIYNPELTQGMYHYRRIEIRRDEQKTFIYLTYPYGKGMPPEIPYPLATDKYEVTDNCDLKYIESLRND